MALTSQPIRKDARPFYAASKDRFIRLGSRVVIVDESNCKRADFVKCGTY